MLEDPTTLWPIVGSIILFLALLLLVLAFLFRRNRALYAESLKPFDFSNMLGTKIPEYQRSQSTADEVQRLKRDSIASGARIAPQELEHEDITILGKLKHNKYFSATAYSY